MSHVVPTLSKSEQGDLQSVGLWETLSGNAVMMAAGKLSTAEKRICFVTTHLKPGI